MVGYIGPKAIQYNVDNSVVEGDSSIGGDSSVGGNLTVDGNLQVNGSISPPYPTVANANILINPSFTVKQRGDVIEHDVGDSFGPDRWLIRGKVGVGGTKVESSTEVEDATGINKLVVKHEGTTSGTAYIYQFIEAVNIQGLYSKKMTFSFSYSDVGGSGIPKVRVLSYDSSDTSKTLYDAVPTSLGDNRWACTVTLSTTDGTIPDPSEKGMQVLIWPNEKNPPSAKWSLWETKLEAGSVATPFIARQYGEELSLCQRYYYMMADTRSGSTSGSLIGTAFKYATSTHAFANLPVEMRSIPSLIKVFNGPSPALRVLMASANVNFSELEIDADSTTTMVRFNSSNNNVASAPDGSGGWLRINADDSYVALDAEL